MKTKLFFSFLLISLLIGVFTPKVKADTIPVDCNIVPNYSNLVQCENDTLRIYNSIVPNPDGISHVSGGISYASPAVIVTKNSITYSNDNGVTWITSNVSSSGEWRMEWNMGFSTKTVYVYWTTPTVEPFPNPAENICGASGTLYSGHYEAGIYYTWWQDGSIVAEGYYPNDTSFTYYASGEYVLEMVGGCNTVRDTVNITLVDNTLPDLGPDQLFCGENDMVNVMLDINGIDPNGVYQSWSWSDGSSDEFIHITSPGTYWIEVNNACLTGVRDSIEITHFSYPDVNILGQTNICPGGSTQLCTNFSYDVSMWNQITDTDTVTIAGGSMTDCVTISDSMIVMVYVRQGMCPSETYQLPVTMTTPYDQTEICIATVDVTGQNKIVWNKEYDQGISHYNIYRLNIGYDLVGIIDFAEPAVFYDQTANPMSSAYRYKISVVDTCGNESALSTFHGTIHITSNAGTAGGIDLTITDHYIDESGEFVPPFYHVMIDSTNSGELNAIAQMSSVFNSYHVENPYPGASYALAAELPWTCDPNAKAPENYAISNKSVVYTGLANEIVSELSIFPNPATDQIQIITDQTISEITVYSITGQEMLKLGSTNTVDVSGLAAGSYSLRIVTESGVAVERVVVE